MEEKSARIGGKRTKEIIRKEQEKKQILRREELRKRAESVNHVKVVYREPNEELARRPLLREIEPASEEYRSLRKEAFLEIIKGAAKAGKKRGVYRTHTMGLDAASKHLGKESYEELMRWLDMGHPEDWKWNEAKAFREEILGVSIGGNHQSNTNL